MSRVMVVSLANLFVSVSGVEFSRPIHGAGAHLRRSEETCSCAGGWRILNLRSKRHELVSHFCIGIAIWGSGVRFWML